MKTECQLYPALPSIMLCVFFVMALVACDKREAPSVAVTPLVSTLKLAPVSLTLDEEFPGRVAALRSAEIRPQVSGIVLRRLFEQGAEVKAGQALFKIDSAAFIADKNAAVAALERAEVAALRAKQQAIRLKPLVEADAVSRQSYDDAVSASLQAEADVAQAKSTLARRALDVDYAQVKAPLTGRIGQAMVTEGALVSSTDTNPMALIQQIDKVYVDVRQPAAMIDPMRKVASQRQNNVVIVGSNGKPYDVKGQILFSGINVDTSTGDTLVRVEVDNHHRELLPGMYVRARLPRGGEGQFILVPQQAIQRDSSGHPQVWVIDSKGQASLKPVKLGQVVHGQYVLQSGVDIGDTLVVEGYDRLQEGIKVDARPWKSATVATDISAN